jgi:hypothetical protein
MFAEAITLAHIRRSEAEINFAAASRRYITAKCAVYARFAETRGHSADVHNA